MDLLSSWDTTTNRGSRSGRPARKSHTRARAHPQEASWSARRRGWLRSQVAHWCAYPNRTARALSNTQPHPFLRIAPPIPPLSCALTSTSAAPRVRRPTGDRELPLDTSGTASVSRSGTGARFRGRWATRRDSTSPSARGRGRAQRDGDRTRTRHRCSHGLRWGTSPARPAPVAPGSPGPWGPQLASAGEPDRMRHAFYSDRPRAPGRGRAVAMGAAEIFRPSSSARRFRAFDLSAAASRAIEASPARSTRGTRRSSAAISSWRSRTSRASLWVISPLHGGARHDATHSTPRRSPCSANSCWSRGSSRSSQSTASSMPDSGRACSR